jgi:hypothetical protein
MDEQHPDLAYNAHLEDLIASEGEKALAYQWLHDKAEKRYSHLNTILTLPVIVFSTLAGTASIGSKSLFGDSDFASVGIGLVSILVGVLNTVSSFFGWAKRSEGHRIATITYAKLHRFVSVELSLPREQRVAAKEFLKQVREQTDRLMETSPAVPQPVIADFQTRFKNVPSDISVPEICNGLHKVDVYPTPTFQDTLSQLSVLVQQPTQNVAPEQRDTQ